MTRLTLELNGFHLHDQAFDDLRRALEVENFEVEFSPYHGSSFGWDLAVHAAEVVEDHVLEALVAILVLRLRSWGRNGKAPKRYVTIYGPKEEVLREIELDD